MLDKICPASKEDGYTFEVLFVLTSFSREYHFSRGIKIILCQSCRKLLACHPLFKVSDMVGLKMAARFDRNPFVVAFYSLKLLLEIRSVINVKKM